MGKQLQGVGACASELAEVRAHLRAIVDAVDIDKALKRPRGKQTSEAVLFARLVCSVEGIEAVVRAMLDDNAGAMLTRQRVQELEQLQIGRQALLAIVWVIREGAPKFRDSPAYVNEVHNAAWSALERMGVTMPAALHGYRGGGSVPFGVLTGTEGGSSQERWNAMQAEQERKDGEKGGGQ